MTDLLERFGNAVRLRRVKLNLTQSELANKAKIHVNAIGRIERGSFNPSLCILYRLAKALECGIDDLIRGKTYD